METDTLELTGELSRIEYDDEIPARYWLPKEQFRREVVGLALTFLLAYGTDLSDNAVREART